MGSNVSCCDFSGKDQSQFFTTEGTEITEGIAGEAAATSGGERRPVIELKESFLFVFSVNSVFSVVNNIFTSS